MNYNYFRPLEQTLKAELVQAFVGKRFVRNYFKANHTC